MNAKTYMTLAGFSPILFFGSIPMMIPGAPPAVLLSSAFCLLLAILSGLAGAVLCVIMLFTKRGLRLGCPFCGDSSRVPGFGEGKSLILFCEQCGPCLVRMREFRTAVAEKLPLDDGGA